MTEFGAAMHDSACMPDRPPKAEGEVETPETATSDGGDQLAAMGSPEAVFRAGSGRGRDAASSSRMARAGSGMLKR
jgi:hypothetical protein